jgi:deferrochelatase/peroxidase EfeB
VPLQEGIYYQKGQKAGRCFAILFLRAQSGISAVAMDQCLSGLASVYAELRAGRIGDLPGVVLPASSLTILIGYGPKVFSISGVRRALPFDLGPQHQFRSPRAAGGGSVLIGSGLTYAEGLSRNPATEEVVIQAIADTPLGANRVIVETAKHLDDHPDPVTGVAPLQLACAFTGFNREDGRSWIDFHDGVSNLASGDERFGAIAVKPQGVAEDRWTEQGTYLAFLRLAVDLPAWRKLTRTQQELLVGRTKLTGCPIQGVDPAGEPVAQTGCPFTGTSGIFEPGNEGFREPSGNVPAAILDSHVQRANHHIGPVDRDVSARFYRQGFEFLDPPGPGRAMLAGLNFVSFQDTLRRLFFVLTTPGWLGATNFGGPSNAHLADTLLTVYAAGVFLCPPVVVGERYPGQSIFV